MRISGCLLVALLASPSLASAQGLFWLVDAQDQFIGEVAAVDLMNAWVAIPAPSVFGQKRAAFNSVINPWKRLVAIFTSCRNSLHGPAPQCRPVSRNWSAACVSHAKW